MIARLNILLPFRLTLLEGSTINVYTYQDDNCEIAVYPPTPSQTLSSLNEPDSIIINGANGIQCDILRIDFIAPNFSRTRGQKEIDPSPATIRRAINSFLGRVRYVTRTPLVRFIDFPEATWKLKYLNDDGSELQDNDKILYCEVGANALHFRMSAILPEMWDDAQKLGETFEPPQWSMLLLDADAALPHIGASIVLNFTALEVLISTVLERLGREQTTPKLLWNWINTREWLKSPSTDEQYSDLLQFFTTRSLKDNATLWRHYKELKKARNSFVHEGIATIGGSPVTKEQAKQFISNSREIIDFVCESLPDEHKWPVFTYKVDYTLRKTIKRGPS